MPVGSLVTFAFRTIRSVPADVRIQVLYRLLVSINWPSYPLCMRTKEQYALATQRIELAFLSRGSPSLVSNAPPMMPSINLWHCALLGRLDVAQPFPVEAVFTFCLPQCEESLPLMSRTASFTDRDQSAGLRHRILCKQTTGKCGTPEQEVRHGLGSSLVSIASNFLLAMRPT